MKRGIAQITDATIAWAVITFAIVTILVPLMTWAAEEYRMNVAAGQANTVQKAVNRFIADQQSTIAAGSSATAGYTLTVPMLISAGYLPAGYSPVNAYTAAYRTLIFQPAAGKFHTMTFLTGGSTLSMSEARKLATHIGAEGGYIENSIAKGALGSWQENLSAFGGFNPGDAHVVIAGFYSNGALVNDYLYRHSVAGHPELNTMGTALNMGSNDVTNARTVSGQTLNASADVNSARVTATQSVTSRGTITATGNITSSKDILANGTLRAAHDAVVGGVIKLNQVNTVGTKCDTWGEVSRDSSGAVLSCQRGIWKLQSTPIDTLIVRSSGTCLDSTAERAICPSGSKLISGGYILTKYGDGSNHNSPDQAYPDPASNSFIIITPNNQRHGTCFIATAVCSRQ